MKLDELVSEERIADLMGGVQYCNCEGHVEFAIRTAVREGAVAALERAARLVDDCSHRVLDLNNDSGETPWLEEAASEVRVCAAAIRALTVED